MPKIPCRVESGPEGGRKKGKPACHGGREGTFSGGKKSPPFPRPPFPPQKTAHRANRTMGGVSEKNGQDDTTGRDEKMWPSLPPFCQRHARHHGSSLLSTAYPSGIRFSHSFRSAPAALPPPASHAAPFAFRLSSPVIEGAAWATYAEGVVPPLLRRAPHSTRDQRGARGCRGPGACAGPDPLPPRRAGDPARMPGNGRHPTAISQSASGSIPRQRPP